MKQSVLACTIVALAGCAPAPEESASPTTSAPVESSPTGAATASDRPKPVMQASFVAEDQPGDGPALLRMFNDTPDQVLSLTLDDNQEYALYLIDPLAVSDYTITASDDMFADAILSIHSGESCVRKPFAEMTGPLALEPGHAYAIRVAIDGGFVGLIEEEAVPEPFIGVRAHVADPSASLSPSPAPSDLVLSTGGASPGELKYHTIFNEFPVAVCEGPRLEDRDREDPLRGPGRRGARVIVAGRAGRQPWLHGLRRRSGARRR